jgi:hypothetical protein
MMCFELISATTMASAFGPGAAAFTALDAIGAISTVVSIGGAFSGAQAQRDQYAYQAQVDKQKATLRERQAVDVTKRGEEEARIRKAQIKSISSTQLVALAGQGGDVTTGTAVDLLTETKELGKLEEEQIRSNAARKASSIRADVTNQLASASAAQFAADAQSPLLDATSTALKGFGQVGAQWYKRRTG